MRIEQFDQLGKVGQGPCQAIDLVDDNDIKLPGGGYRPAISAGRGDRWTPPDIPRRVISRPDQVPAGMGLTLNIS